MIFGHFIYFGHFPIEIPIEAEKYYHHGKELSYRENKMCSETRVRRVGVFDFGTGRVGYLPKSSGTGTGSEKILKAKSTSIGPLIFIIDIITITFYETTI